MELVTRTKSGATVRLTVERDKHEVHQVYAYLRTHDGANEERYLCDGWGASKTPEGLVQGILAQGQILEVPRDDWMTIVARREDFRDRENLADIHLVKIFSHGDQLTIDGYTLSARVDRETWGRIESCMHFVNSSVNDVLYAGDHFTGWIIEAGREEEVERMLGVKPEHSLRGRMGTDG